MISLHEIGFMATSFPTSLEEETDGMDPFRNKWDWLPTLPKIVKEYLQVHTDGIHTGSEAEVVSRIFRKMVCRPWHE